MKEAIHPAIKEAIIEGVKAGVFRRAARLNPRSTIWAELADAHKKKVEAALARFAESAK